MIKKTYKELSSYRNSKNFGKRYNWNEIQIFYDSGNSWNDVVLKFGMTHKAIQKAIARGDFKTRTKSEAAKLSIKKYGPKRMGTEARMKLSLSQSLHNRGGKSKWFVINNQKVQGTWERDLALKLTELKIEWIKLKTHKDVWPYVINGELKHYTPDFYIPKYNVYLDPKGYWWGNDKQKIEEVKRQHSDKKLIILEKIEFEKLLSGDISILTI